MPSRLIPFIPNFKPVRFVSVLSEVMDWGSEFTHVYKYRQMTGSNGENIKVCILDTGLTEHPDIKENIYGSADCTGNNDATDNNFHGCHVAGIIGAGKNNFGVIGVAPKCKLYMAKVMGDNGTSPSDYSWINKGLEYALDVDADIINMSLGAPTQPPFRTKQLIDEIINRGNIVVAASGNDGAKRICYPAKYKNVISVGAMNEDGTMADYSNVDSELDLIAPGTNVYSTYGKDGYAAISGTSMATPFISGVIALILAYHRNTEQPHDTPVNNCIDALNHLKKFQKGNIVENVAGVNIGFLDFDCNDVSILDNNNSGCLFAIEKFFINLFSK